MSDQLTLTLDFPRGPSGQNSREHWAKKAKRTKAARQSTCRVVSDAARGARWPAAILDITIYYPDRRRRDDLNTIEPCKADIDGIVDSGLIPDDDWTHLQLRSWSRCVDRENPRIELTLTQTERL